MASAEVDAAAGEAPYFEALREGLTSFYGKYNAAKVGDAPGLLDRFRLKERELVLALSDKYGDEATREFHLPSLVGALMRFREGAGEALPVGGLEPAVSAPAEDAGAPLVAANGGVSTGPSPAEDRSQVFKGITASLASTAKAIGNFAAETDAKSMHMALKSAQAARRDAQHALKQAQREAQDLRQQLSKQQKAATQQIASLEKEVAALRERLDAKSSEAAALAAAREAADRRADGAEEDVRRAHDQAAVERRRADEASRASGMEALRRLLAAGGASEGAVGGGGGGVGPGAEAACPAAEQRARALLGEGDGWVESARSALRAVYAAALSVDEPEAGGSSDSGSSGGEEGVGSGGEGGGTGAAGAEWVDALRGPVQELASVRRGAPAAARGEVEVSALGAWLRVLAHAAHSERQRSRQACRLRRRRRQVERRASDLSREVAAMSRDAASRGMETAASRSELKKLRADVASLRTRCEVLEGELGGERAAREEAEGKVADAQERASAALQRRYRAETEAEGAQEKAAAAEEEAAAARSAALRDAALATAMREHWCMAAEDALGCRWAQWAQRVQLAEAVAAGRSLRGAVAERDEALEALAEHLAASDAAIARSEVLREGSERHLMGLEDSAAMRREVDDLRRALAAAKALAAHSGRQSGAAGAVLFRVSSGGRRARGYGRRARADAL